MTNRPVDFLFPIDGDCVTPSDGRLFGERLLVKAVVRAQEGIKVTINGIEALEEKAGIFSAEVAVEKKTVITAVSDNGDTSITVYRLDVNGGYRISVDDNIRFFAELTELYKSGAVSSIFEHPYLKVYKDAHDLYGACIHLNLFYETDTVTNFRHVLPYFNLSMMTDAFKSEWEQNSDWLKLSFHSKKEFPEFPYKESKASEVAEDYANIKREIIRFAGEASFSEVTTVHYGSCSEAGLAQLKKDGIKTLMGIFELGSNGLPSVGYDFPPALAEHISNRDFWYSSKYEMLFGRIDIVLNNHSLDENMKILEDISTKPGRAAFLELMIHEQYFYSDYSAYIPNFREFILETCKWAAEHGYRGMDEIMIC